MSDLQKRNAQAMVQQLGRVETQYTDALGRVAALEKTVAMQQSQLADIRAQLQVALAR